MPASARPSSPPVRFVVTSGRSTHGSVCGCCAFTLPKASRIFPTFVEEAAGERREGDVALLERHLVRPDA